MFPDELSMRPAIVSAVKREFHGHSRHLTHDRPEQFAQSQWHGRGSVRGVWAFLVYRWLLALFLVSALVISIVDIRTLGRPGGLVRRAKWPIYMTNWAFLMLTVQAVLAAVLATKHHLAVGAPVTGMTRLHKVYWVLNTLSNCLAPGITFGYWVIVYNPEIHVVDFVNVTVHVVNTAVVLLDVCVAGHPVRLLHAYLPVILTAVYSSFSALYFLAGGTNRDNNPQIYPLLNWSKPQWALVATLAAAILLVILHILFWLVFLLRRRLALAAAGKERKAQITTQNCGEVTITSGIV